MGILDALKPRVPEVPVDPSAQDGVIKRVEAMMQGEPPQAVVQQLHALVREDLFTRASDFRAASGLDDECLAVELYLQAFTGFVLAAEEGVGRARALEMVKPYEAALREFVGLGYRKRYDEGAATLIRVVAKLSLSGRDPRRIALSLTPMRLGLSMRRGAVEGLVRLALLAQLAGYGAGELALIREQADRDDTDAEE